MRYCSDLMQTQSLTQIQDHACNLVIDLGAKYDRTPKLLTSVQYLPVRPNLDEYDNLYHRNHQKHY